MKNLLTILLFATVVFVTGCQKDDYTEIVGLCPIVVATSPANGATAASLDANIAATFNTELDSSTINASSFMLNGPNAVNGTLSYGNQTITFNPTNQLLPNTTYTATVTTLVKDITGNAMQQNYEWSFVTGSLPIPLNTMSRFGVFAKEGISNLGLTKIWNMDVGLWDANRSSLTGFPPGEVINGATFARDDLFPAGVAAMLTNANAELIQAYQLAENLNSPSKKFISGDQGGKTLTPGIYKSVSNLNIENGNLTLDAKGDANAVWVFQIGGDLFTQGNQGGNVILAGGAQAKNIFWQTAESATIGGNTSFHGNVMALNDITLNSGSIIEGRMLSQNGTVDMNTATITNPN